MLKLGAIHKSLISDSTEFFYFFLLSLLLPVMALRQFGLLWGWIFLPQMRKGLTGAVSPIRSRPWMLLSLSLFVRLSAGGVFLYLSRTHYWCWLAVFHINWVHVVKNRCRPARPFFPHLPAKTLSSNHIARTTPESRPPRIILYMRILYGPHS